MYRPNDWNNPYNFQAGGAVPKYEIQSRCFDEGADALFEALRQEGNSRGGHVVDDVRGTGTWIFIPEEGE